MKIIGATQYGYIIEASADEVAYAAGYAGAYGMPHGMTDRDRRLPVGTVLAVDKTFSYLAKLRDHEARVKQSESLLRALADMLHTALPTTIIPPEATET